MGEYCEGQWWLKELDAMAKTPDQRRAVAVVRKMMVEQHQGEPVAWMNTATGAITAHPVQVMDWDDESEPSAPIHTSDHRLMTSARELPDAERAKVQLMVSLLPSEESARILSKGAGRILTSDETVEKFYRQIVEASEVKPSAPEWDGKSWDVVYQREGKTVLSIRSDGVMDVYDRDGVKALMFDLINMEYGAIVERDERAAFEAWYADWFNDVYTPTNPLTAESMKQSRKGNNYGAGSLGKNGKWSGWQARAAMERKP